MYILLSADRMLTHEVRYGWLCLVTDCLKQTVDEETLKGVFLLGERMLTSECFLVSVNGTAERTFSFEGDSLGRTNERLLGVLVLSLIHI